MNHTGLTRMIKIEVLAVRTDARAVRDVFRNAGVTAWTHTCQSAGLSPHASELARRMFLVPTTLEAIITVLAEGQADGVLAELHTRLADTSAVLFVSEAWVSRPDYFR